MGETPPQELLSVGEFLEARRAVLAELRQSEQAAPAVQPASELLPPGCDEPPPGVPAQLPGLVSVLTLLPQRAAAARGPSPAARTGECTDTAPPASCCRPACPPSYPDW